MKKHFSLFFALLFLLSSCTSYDAWHRTTTGMSLGALFGSTVGGIIGGADGADAGMLIGGAMGGAVGAASAKAAEEQRLDHYEDRKTAAYGDRRYPNGDVRYGRYGDDDYAPFSSLEINRLVFADANGNHVLEPGERAYISFEIHNRSNQMLRNVAPIVMCNYKRVHVSPTAIIGDLLPGQGMRYRAAVVAQTNVRDRNVRFDIAFPDADENAVVHKTFTIRTVGR